MAEIRAFRGWRYNLAHVGELSDVIAPPYDVITPELQDALYARHPANVVRLELSKDEPDDSERENRYTRAARYLHQWKLEGTLVEDSSPAIYGCRQQFELAGQAFVRRGFMARVRLEPFGAGCIYPHEQTMPGPKADRLRLLHATGMNLSPIFGLYSDPQNEVQQTIERATRGHAPVEAGDHLGVVSRLWPLSDHALVSQVCGLMGPRAVFIADGHHRYETALRYLDEQRTGGMVRDEESPANFVLMMCVSMSDTGLVILPTHRLVTGLASLRSHDLWAALAREFDLEPVGAGAAACRDAWELIEADGSQNVIGLGTTADGRWLLARLRDATTMSRLVPQHSPAWRGLAVSILHELLLGQLLRPPGDAPPKIRYVHLLDEVIEAAAKPDCDLACLVPPASMQHVQQIASQGERMPAKSTYFYPKLPTGLVLNPVA
jgi:uncharacterized protein (DUF1015 family)